MKSVFITVIVAVAMIGVMVPIEFAEAQGPDSESVTAYYIGSILGEAIFIVLVPVSIAYVIARLRFGGKKNDWECYIASRYSHGFYSN